MLGVAQCGRKRNRRAVLDSAVRAAYCIFGSYRGYWFRIVFL